MGPVSTLLLMAQDWDIKPRGESCSVCETPFADGQRYFAALTFGKEGYMRTDYCETCWAAREDEGTPYSMWQGTFIMPPPAPEEPLKKETAESLLRRLMEDEDPSKVNAIYILAVMLERKRILVERDIRVRENDDMMIRVYEHRKSGETFLVPDPRLGFEELETVQQEVADMLGWTRKDEEAEAPAEEEEPEASPPTPESKLDPDKTAGLKDGFFSKEA